MKNELIALVKIDSMSSLEISELTGKRHGDVLRDIRNILEELKDDADLRSGFKSVTYKAGNGKDETCFTMNKLAVTILVTGYSVVMRAKVMARWQYLEDQLTILKNRTDTKKHQLEAMEALSHLLPDDLSGEALSYIKANTVVNKAVSNLFGFPKMLKKAEMSPDMLAVRDNVLDDYIKLYEVVEDNAIVKDALYAKYQPRRLEVAA